jgi:hypothetical protein
LLMKPEDSDAALHAGLALLAVLAFLTVAWRIVRKRLRTGQLSVPKAIMLGGCFLFLLSGLFPPWLYTRSGHTVRSAGYCFLLTAPKPEGYNGGIKLDAERLAIEWLCILVGSGMGLALFPKSSRAAGQAIENPKSPLPPVAKARRYRWTIPTCFVSLAIISISWAVWVVDQPTQRPNALPAFAPPRPNEQPRPTVPPTNESQIVRLEDGSLHEFPADATPAEMEAALNEAFPFVRAKESPQPIITLQGISTFDGKRALLKVQMPSPRGEQPKGVQSFVLAEGQKEAGIKVLEIDAQEGTVKVNNLGMITKLYLQDGKPQSATARGLARPEGSR